MIDQLKMKKVILAIVTMLAAATLATVQMHPTIKVEVGANFANQTTKVGDKSTDGEMMIGYRAGVGVEFGITDGFYVNPGVYFLSRGSKATVEIPEIVGTASKTAATMWLHNVEIPVHAGYHAALASDMAISIQAGPWFSYGFLGEVPQKTTITSEGKIADAARKVARTADRVANKGEKNPCKSKVLKPSDLGVGMQAGLEYQQSGLNLGFEYGLLNTSAVENVKVNNMNFYVGLGYRF